MGQEMFVFRKIWHACFLEIPVLKFALLPYYRRVVYIVNCEYVIAGWDTKKHKACFANPQFYLLKKHLKISRPNPYPDPVNKV